MSPISILTEHGILALSAKELVEKLFRDLGRLEPNRKSLMCLLLREIDRRPHPSLVRPLHRGQLQVLVDQVVATDFVNLPEERKGTFSESTCNHSNSIDRQY